jgi:Anti-sigma-K factor rskA
MNGVRCQDYRAAYLEGNLDGAALSHRSTCGGCRAAEPSLDGLRASLADPVFWEEPVPDLEGRVVEAVAGGAEARPRSRKWLWPGVAAAVVVVLLGAWLLVANSGPDWRVELMGVGDTPGATARVDGWATEDGSHMVVEVAGLGPAASGTVYELWLSADRSSVSAGSFRDDGRFEMTVGVSRRDFPRLWVTIEEPGGEPGPSSETVLDDPEFVDGMSSRWSATAGY